MRILGIFAHPDDESLFAGGTLASHALDGHDVRTVTLTAGEAAEHIDDLEEAARRRLARFHRACEHLGIRGIAYRPGLWRDLGHRAVDGTLALADLDAVVAAVAELLDEHCPDLVVTVDADGVTGHPDHMRAHEAVAAQPGLRTWAAGVRRTDVKEVIGDRGYEGGIRGVETSDLVEVAISADAAEAKRQALSAYYPSMRETTGQIGDVELLLGIGRLHDDRREFFREL